MFLLPAFKRWLPPAILELPLVSTAVRHFRGVYFSGNYASFEEASARCGKGYSEQNVIRSAIERVREERNARSSARGGVLRNIDARLGYALLHARLRTYLDIAAPFRVLDFGGGPGQHYFLFEQSLGKPLHWVIAETEAMARAGAEYLSTEELSFVSSLGDLQNRRFHVVLASGSLQYVSDPYAVVSALASLGAQFLVIDRLPLISSESDRLTIQRDPRLYDGTYPAWFFSTDKWIAHTRSLGFRIIFEWDVPEDSPYLDDAQVPYRGFLLTRASAEGLP